MEDEAMHRHENAIQRLLLLSSVTLRTGRVTASSPCCFRALCRAERHEQGELVSYGESRRAMATPLCNGTMTKVL